MPAPEERIQLGNLVRMSLEGADDSGNKETRTLLIRKDRALVIWNRLVAYNGTREQVIVSDAQNLLRVRPYEGLLPVTPVVLTTSAQVLYTSTARRSKVWLDVVNHANTNGVTVRIFQRVVASGNDFDWYPSSTPVPIGVPIRTGHITLESGDSIRALSGIGNTVTVHTHVDRYNATGDTP